MTAFAAAACAVLLSAAPGAAQEGPASLERLVASVAALWAEGRADEIVALAPRDGRIVLDVPGEGSGPVQPRHAAAALRRLLGDRETRSVRATRVTVSGGTPARGFGELVWVSRGRGMNDFRTATVYVGAVLEDGTWRLRELRMVR